MKYIVLSTTVWDSIFLPGRGGEINAVGGAGIYALAGMKVWEDDIGIVTGVGADYLPKFRGWYEQNSIPTDGLIVKDAFTPHTIIRYRADGERTETPMYGIDHYRKIEGTPEDLARFAPDADGVYVFKNADGAFWKRILELKRQYGFRLLWEIGADAAVKKLQGAVLDIARQTEMFSINLTEARTLFGCTEHGDVIRALGESGIPLVYLRNGSSGTYLIRADEVVHVPSVQNASVVDATGGGNSSTGGALIGLCRNCSLTEIGAMGNVSASFCIAQYGVPPRFDAAVRDEATRRKEAILRACKEEGSYEQ